jgi:micrococcal nuclease
VRLYGINTPELHSPVPEDRVKAQQAKSFLMGFLGTKYLTIKTEKDKTEKYGRYLAVIFADADPVAVNQKLLDAGLAVPYFGKNE